ncbi:MAG: zinc-ribbon domain-containing protein [Calditrichaeota bacterium]|nr:MAG: zinc-ribbon domain-containing protein [Calditrichota bacterium]
MKKCFNCGQEADDSAKFCSDCGTKFESTNDSTENRCVKCDALQRDDAKFCHVCGASIVSEEESKKVLEASWDDYKVSKKKGKRSAGTIYPILMIPALVAFIFIFTQNNNEPQHNHEEPTQEMSQAQMRNTFAEIDSLKTLLEKNPADTTALEKLGMYYDVAGNFSQSREFYLKHLQITPNNTDIRMRVANTYYSEKNYIAANQEMEKILKRTPDDLMALYNHGLLLSLMGNKLKAKSQWERVVELDKGGKMAESAQKAIDFLKGN